MKTAATIRQRGMPLQPSMVRATLREREPKTQTRRVINPQPIAVWGSGVTLQDPKHFSVHARIRSGDPQPDPWIRCPYGKPGDRIWVREPWRAEARFDHTPPREIPRGAPIYFEAGGGGEEAIPECAGRYRYARYMCRWMSRITLEITAIRAQRLQEISETDAKAEGVTSQLMPVAPGEDRLLWGVDGPWWTEDAISAYLNLWEDIHNPKGYCPDDNPVCWGANPWVWAITFRRLPCE